MARLERRCGAALAVGLILAAVACGCAAPGSEGTATAGAATTAPRPQTVQPVPESPGTAAEDNRPVLVAFTKPGCPACMKLAPVLAEVKKEYAEKVRFEEINIEQAKPLVIEYMITGTPTVIMFADRKPVGRELNPSESALRALLDSAVE